MKGMVEEEYEECTGLIFELETLIECWQDACVQHKHMFTLLKKDGGNTNCIAKGCEMTLKTCISDIKELIRKYS